MSRTASDEDNKRIIMDLDVLVKSFDFPHIVRCLGYFIQPVTQKNNMDDGHTYFFHDRLEGSMDLHGADGLMLR
jgi:hypothetical protein